MSPWNFSLDPFDPYMHQCDKLTMKDLPYDFEKSYVIEMLAENWELVAVMHLGFTIKYYYWERVRYPITVPIGEYIEMHFEVKMISPVTFCEN